MAGAQNLYTPADIIPLRYVLTSSLPVRLRSWLKEGVLGSPIIFPTVPSSRLYLTPSPTLRAAASMISVSEYRYGAPAFVCVADLALPPGIVLHGHARPPLDVLLSVLVVEGMAKWYDRYAFRPVRAALRRY